MQRAHGHDRADGYLTAGRWEDAIAPHAAWRGLWSAKRASYRFQRLGNNCNALANCRALLHLLQAVSEHSATQ